MAQCWRRLRGAECELKSGSSTARKTRLKSKRPVSSAALRKVGSAPGSRASTHVHQPAAAAAASTCCWLTLVVLLVALVVSVPQQRASAQLVPPVLANNRHTIASMAGDLVVGALVPVHERPTPSQAQTRTCGNVREHYGIQRVEAAFQIIDSINADPSILPNITLGIEIRDSCWHSPIALEQAIEFIRDAMAAGDLSPATSGANKLPAQQASALLTGLVDQQTPGAGPVGSPYANASNCPAQAQPRRLKNIVGVVGPASSQDTVQVQNLLQLFNMPQIGYSATSRDLSNKNFFKFFLRLVPSDKLQALALIDLMLAHNWTYVTIAYTEGSYGSSLMNAFRERAQEAGICFATLESMPPNADDIKFDELIDAIQKHPNARVVVCMCEGRTVGRLFAAFKRHSISNEYLVVGSDGWSDRFDVVEDHEEFALGGISVRIHSAYLHDFDHNYFALRPHTNHRNPWFAEFWEQRFQCNLRGQPAAARRPGRQYERDCTGKESLRDNHKQDSKLAFVQKSIMTMALGLDSLQRATCPTAGLCQEMLPINGSLLLQHLMNVSFSYLGETVYFDRQGDPPGQYDILNFRRRKQLASAASQLDRSQVGGAAQPQPRPEQPASHSSGAESQVAPGGDSYSTLRLAGQRRGPSPLASHTNHPSGGAGSQLVDPVNSSASLAPASSKRNFEYGLYATWKSGDGLLMLGGLQWWADEALAGRPPPSSVCSLPCTKGHAKRIQSDSAKCCWVCVPCRAHEYLADQFKCQACDKGWWPNAAQTGCYQIPIQYLDWRSSEALFALSIAVVGLLLTLVTGYIFIRHNDTPVVKSTTRELSYIILLAMLLCHACTFFLVAKPTRTTCFVSRVLPGLALAMMYGALVTKTNRIARILAGSKKKILTRRPLFMSASAQLLITWIIVLIECCVVVVVVVRESPPDITHAYPSEAQVVLVCNTTTTGIIAPLSFDFFLIAMCTWYAFKTRNVPENFNEAKFIGFTMYTTLVIWVAFVAIYLSSNHKVTALSLCISFSALFPLLLLFFPRCYIILVKPEKNNRSFFTTTKNVRCHIGYPLAGAAAAAAASSPGHLSPARQLSAAYYLQQQQHQVHPAHLHQGAANSSAAPTASNSLDSQQEPAAAAADLLAAYSSSNAKRSAANGHERPSIANCCDSLARVAPIPDTPELAGPAAGTGRPPSGSLWEAVCALFARRSRRKESDKATSIQQHLRAIRRAENLDRQTHFRRSQAQRSLQRFETARLSPNPLQPVGLHLGGRADPPRRASHNDQLVGAPSHRPNRDSLDSQHLIEAFAELVAPANVGRLARRLAQVPEVEKRLAENSRHSVLAMLACLDELARAAGNGRAAPASARYRDTSLQGRPDAGASLAGGGSGALCKSSSADSRLNLLGQSRDDTRQDTGGRLLLWGQRQTGGGGGSPTNDNSPTTGRALLYAASSKPAPNEAPHKCLLDYHDDPIGRTLERIMNPHRSWQAPAPPICTPSSGPLAGSPAALFTGPSKRANLSSSGNRRQQQQQLGAQNTATGRGPGQPADSQLGAGHSGGLHKCHIAGPATATANKIHASFGAPLMSANSSQRPSQAEPHHQHQHLHQRHHPHLHRRHEHQPSHHCPAPAADSQQHASATSNWTQKWAHATQLSIPQAPANEINGATSAQVCDNRQARRPRTLSRRHAPAPCCHQPAPPPPPTATTTSTSTAACSDRCRRLDCHQCFTPCSQCSICRARSRSRARQSAPNLQPEADPCKPGASGPAP